MGQTNRNFKLNNIRKMSRTRESTNIASPVETFIFFNGNTGKFGRPVEDGEGMVDIELPLNFVVLDDAAYRIGGETRGGGTKRKITSNLAHRDFGRRLTVTYKDNGALIAEGEWSQIQGTVKDLGGKYTMVLYCLVKMDEKYRICALHLRGRALAEWFKFSKGKNVCGDFFYSVRSVSKTQGEDVDSYVPHYSEHKIPAAVLEEAFEADAILQAWLESFFAASNDLNIQAAARSRSSAALPDGQQAEAPQVVAGDPYDTDDLPF